MTRNLMAGRSGAGRPGFTLPEILVVMLIIAVLVALLSAAAAKFRESQMAYTTDAQLSRLQGDLNDTYNRSVQRCRTEDRPPAALITACGNPDIAQAVHVAATLKANFPENFGEAGTPVSFTVGGTPFNYPAKKTFASVAGLTGVPAEKQRAVLLYLILTERGSSESGSPGERRTERLGGKDLTYFIDLYGQPITYYRWGWVNGTPLPATDELNRPPFAPSGGSPDPLDPQGWVSSKWSASPALPPDTRASAAEIVAIRNSLQFGGTGTTFTGSNRVPTVVSYGKNKQFESFLGDDAVGYRLNRLGGQGQKGDQ